MDAARPVLGATPSAARPTVGAPAPSAEQRAAPPAVVASRARTGQAAAGAVLVAGVAVAAVASLAPLATVRPASLPVRSRFALAAAAVGAVVASAILAGCGSRSSAPDAPAPPVNAPGPGPTPPPAAAPAPGPKPAQKPKPKPAPNPKPKPKPKPKPDPTTHVRVMSWNVRYFSGSGGDDDSTRSAHSSAARKRIVQEVKRANPDVVVLQEADDPGGRGPSDVERVAKAVGATDVKYVKNQANVFGGTYGQAIITRHGFEIGRTETTAMAPRTGPFPRKVVHASAVRAPDGTKFTVVGLHPQPNKLPGAERFHERQMRVADGVIDDAQHGRHGMPRDVIVAGDFNAGRGRRDDTLHPARRGLEEALGGSAKARATTVSGKALDSIYVDRSMRVTEAHVVRTKRQHGEHPSDHFPVVADVEVPKRKRDS